MHSRRTNCTITSNHSMISKPLRANKTVFWKLIGVDYSGSCKQSLYLKRSFLKKYILLQTYMHLPQWLLSFLLSCLLPCDPSPLWISKVWLSLSVFFASSRLSRSARCLLPLRPTFAQPSFPFLLFCHSCRWWEALSHRAFTPGRPLPGFWQTLIRDDAAVAKPYKLFQE